MQAGSPAHRPWTGTGPWPVRVAAQPGCEASFFYIYIHSHHSHGPHPPPRPPSVEKLSSTETGLWCQNVEDHWVKGPVKVASGRQRGIRALVAKGNEHSHDLFLTVLVRYRSHIIQFTHLKCDSMVLAFTTICNCQHHQLPEHLHHPHQRSPYLLVSTPIPPVASSPPSSSRRSTYQDFFPVFQFSKEQCWFLGPTHSFQNPNETPNKQAGQSQFCTSTHIPIRYGMRPCSIIQLGFRQI